MSGRCLCLKLSAGLAAVMLLLTAFPVTAFSDNVYNPYAVSEKIGPGLVSSEILDLPEDSDIDMDALADGVLDLVNAARAENGLGILDKSETALPAAALRAEETAAVFSHTRPDGRRFYTAYDDTGVTGYMVVGENIAIGQESPEEVMADWMGSESHRANILSPDFKELAVALVYTDKGLIWVQEFLAMKDTPEN